MWVDPIVEELHAHRRQHAAGYDFDVHRLFLALKTLDESPSAVQADVVVLPPKHLKTFKQAA